MLDEGSSRREAPNRLTGVWTLVREADVSHPGFGHLGRETTELNGVKARLCLERKC